MQETSELYEIRFSKDERQLKERVWKPLCEEFFQKFVASDDTVLDIACGYGEFTRFIHAGSKVAIDLNTRSAASLPAGVQFHLCSADSMAPVNTSSIDVAFASNFFEHLPSKDSMDKVLKEIFRVLKPDGRLIMMQPNIKYCAESYWDFYDHHLPLSHLSAAEGLQLNGFKLEDRKSTRLNSSH